MTDLFVGNNIVGNFYPQEKLSGNIESYRIDKIDGRLHLQKDNENIVLEPLDDNAKLVVSNFSNEIGEFNESIYKLEHVNGLVIVVLYVYTEVQKLLLESQSINIHLRRDAEKQICGEGYSDFKLDDPKEIVPFFTDLFINNKSIFAHIDPNNKNSFQIFGKRYRANVIMERPGVYVLDRIFKSYNKEFSFSLTQIYGNIRFVLWSESTEIEGNPSIKLESVKTNDVFRAWNEYMDFERKLYEDELKEKGLIKYTDITVNGDELAFDLAEPLSGTDLSNCEFEFISKYSLFAEGNVRELPKTIDELIELKQMRGNGVVYVGKCHNEGGFNDKLIFAIPDRGFMSGMKDVEGYLYVSDHSLKTEQTRRKKVISVIESKKNESSNIIMKLSAGDVVDTELGTTFNPTNGEVLKKMFGNPNVVLKETYREAMSIALNTPDIALIQGPPGTGKTTLIKGVITRLNMMNKNYRILVSSEQHEALFNVVDKLSQNKFIPPFVSSRRYDRDDDDDNERFEKNVKKFQQNFIALCNDLLRENRSTNRRSIEITEVVYILQTIRDNNYGKNYIATVIDELRDKLISLGYFSEVEKEFSTLSQKIKSPTIYESVDDYDPIVKAIIGRIESQRTDIRVFIEDDGIRQLKTLQTLLKTNSYESFRLDDKIYSKLISDNEDDIKSVFTQYCAYVEKISNQFIPREINEFEEPELTVKDILDDISKKIFKLSKGQQRDFFEIVESLSFRLNDIDSSSEIIKNYTTVVGSTCAQADRSLKLVDLQNDKYDYVIIDEAARANPLDIMIPMMLGTKVILIGDHKQLPHYIESNYVNRFKNEKEKYSGFNEKLLTRSLFHIIYENLELAYKEGRIKFKRTIRIDEQHRMHPAIGNFISDTFYDGGIKNGEKTANHKNDYNVFNGKNVVWLNVPIYAGMENRSGESLNREAEVTRIINVVESLVKKNPNRKLDLGIISFYKGQVELIKSKLKESFPEGIFTNRFDEMCNTVDSYQGKEFDIVIVSGVRSNSLSTAAKSLGFIQYSPSRINVALSRAKRLLIMVADADTYRKNEYFQKFIYYVKKEGHYE